MSHSYDYDYDYDLVVIGAGSGGIACANRAAMYGAKVLVIEASVIGGTCVNLGCVPKKVMWNGANLLEQINHYAKSYGINVTVNNWDYTTLKNNRQTYIDRIHQSYSKSFENNKVTYTQGFGKLVDKHTVAIHTYDKQGQPQVKTVSTDKILLSPGSKSSTPNIAGKELGLHSDDFFNLTAFPKNVIIIGAGYIAVEIAGVMNSFGVKTTLLTRGDRPLRWADRDLTDKLLEVFAQTNLNHLCNSQIHAIEQLDNPSEQGNKFKVITNHGDLETEMVLWAVGRDPNTANLDLGSTKVRLDEKGYIIANELNQTDEDNIYAIGDATHQMPALTPAAIAAGRRLAERLYNNRTNWHFDHKLIPTVIFSHPAIGAIGLSEEDAIKQYGAYSEQNPQGVKIYKSTFTSMISAITDHRQECFMKLVVQGTNEKVIGLHGIGFGVDEMIQGFAVAMNMGATKADFDNTLAIHPTGAEEFVTMR